MPALDNGRRLWREHTLVHLGYLTRMCTAGDGVSVEFDLFQLQVLRRFWRGPILNM